MLSLKRNEINITEVYKSIRINIEYLSKNKEIKTLCVISPESKEGKSTVSSRLALSFSKSDKKTLLIDCNLRNPGCHKIFNIKNEKGLLDIFYKEEELNKVIYNYNSKLDILLTGGISNRNADIIESQKLENLLGELKEQYDYIIIDTPEFNLYSDSEILAKKSDGIILIASIDQTKIESLIKVKKTLDKIHSNVLGVVLNKSTNRI